MRHAGRRMKLTAPPVSIAGNSVYRPATPWHPDLRNADCPIDRYTGVNCHGPYT